VSIRESVQKSIPNITLCTNFKFKPMMFLTVQTIGQFNGTSIVDSHLHLKQFTEAVSNFKIYDVEGDAF